MHTRQTIVRLLSTMDSTREIQQYLKRFSEMNTRRFAIVKVGGAVLRDALPELVSSLSFLQQLELTPIVLHGAGPQLDEELSNAGFEKKMWQGLRVTPARAMGVLRQIVTRQNLRLVEALQNTGTRAASIIDGVFVADYIHRAELGMVGKVTGTHLAPIDTALNARAIPVLTSLGETDEGQILNVNADFATNELARVLKPYKIIFLTATGGLLDGDGQLIDTINLCTDYEKLLAKPWLHGGMRLKIKQIADLLTNLPLTSSVVITHPAELTKELFTHKGSGTLLRCGEKVLRYTSWEGVDQVRLRTLIESSFGRSLEPNYMERTTPYRIYISENYRATMVLTRSGDLPYLDKFAVLDDAQGEGLGRLLWRWMREENPRLFWRSRHNNPANVFYYAEAEGCLKQPLWKVFWYGLNSHFDLIAHCAAYCSHHPPSLVEEKGARKHLGEMVQPS